jgi:predicted amidohydrolase YtcJ
MKSRKAVYVLIAAAAAAIVFAACSSQGGPKAEWVLRNGIIYTVDAERSRAEAVAIRDGVFLYVGSNAGVSAYVGRKTKILDLGGKLVLPGFIDSHCHPSAAVEQFGSVALFGLGSAEGYRKAILDYLAAHPGTTGVRGSGWSNTLFGPRGPEKSWIDAVIPDLPVILASEDDHSVWVNSKTLELAGVTKETPDPPGGVIERDPETGEPSGTLRESAARLVDKIIPEFTVEEIAKGLEEYQTMALGFGITTAHEASLHTGGNPLRAYKELETAGRLRMRFRASLYVDPRLGTDQVRDMIVERGRNAGPLFQTWAAKIFIDGVVEGSTAYLNEPYVHKPGFRGEPLWSRNSLNAVCAALDREGFQLHFHAIGDAAVAEALDGIAFARETNGPREARPLITHLQLVSPADIPRFKELGVVAVVQPFWFMKDDYYHNLQVPFLGERRADEEYPMESFFKAGIPVASSSDYTVTIPCDPLQAIQIGMTRCRPGESAPGDVLWPEERASLDEMIASFTINGAYANYLEDVTGSIETGKSADCIVLDRNLFEIPAAEIGRARVVRVFFEGRPVDGKRFP